MSHINRADHIQNIKQLAEVVDKELVEKAQRLVKAQLEQIDESKADRAVAQKIVHEGRERLKAELPPQQQARFDRIYDLVFAIKQYEHDHLSFPSFPANVQGIVGAFSGEPEIQNLIAAIGRDDPEIWKQAATRLGVPAKRGENAKEKVLAYYREINAHLLPFLDSLHLAIQRSDDPLVQNQLILDSIKRNEKYQIFDDYLEHQKDAGEVIHLNTAKFLYPISQYKSIISLFDTELSEITFPDEIREGLLYLFFEDPAYIEMDKRAELERVADEYDLVGYVYEILAAGIELHAREIPWYQILKDSELWGIIEVLERAGIPMEIDSLKENIYRTFMTKVVFLTHMHENFAARPYSDDEKAAIKESQRELFLTELRQRFMEAGDKGEFALQAHLQALIDYMPTI